MSYHLYKFSIAYLAYDLKIFVSKKRNWFNTCIMQVKNFGFIKLIFYNKGFHFLLHEILYNISKFIWTKLWTMLKSYYTWLLVLKRGYNKRHKVRLRLVGLGNRIVELERKKLILRLGYAHYWLVYKLGKMKFYFKKKKKNSFNIYFNNIFFLNNFVYIVKRLKFPDCYNANGVRFLKEKFKLRKRKRWGVF